MGRTARFTSFLRRNAVLLSLMVIAFAIALTVRSTVFTLYSGNKDEPVYVLQARALAEGHTTLPVYRDLAFFQPWFTAVRGGRLVLAFPPGYAAALAVSQRLFGTMLPALGAIAAACVLGMFLFARELTGDRRIALVAAATLTVSPILVIQSGLFLSYLFTLALGLFFGWALLVSVRERRRGMAVAAGAFLGLVFLTRPLDAVLWGAPFLAYLVVLHRRELRALVGDLVWVLAGFVPLGIVMLGFNAHVTGSPTLFPVTAVDPLNKLGFGVRRIMPTSPPFDYTVHAAISATSTNLRNLPPWAFGSFAGIGLAVVGAVMWRRTTWTYLLLGVAATFVVGYIGFWGLKFMADGSKAIGPQYYIPLFVPIAVLGAAALVWLWERTRVTTMVVAVVLVLLTLVPLHDKFFDNRDFDEAFYRPPYTALHEPHAQPALVFVPPGVDPYLLTNLSFAMNPPDLKASTLYAVDRGPLNLDLVAERRDRAAYALVTRVAETRDGYRGQPQLQRLHVEEASAFEVDQQVTNAGSDPVVTAYLSVDGQTYTQVLDRASTKGASYTVRWLVGPRRSVGTAAPDGATTVALPTTERSFAAGVGFGATADLDPARQRWEVRYAYRIAADATSMQLLLPGIAYHRVPLFGTRVFAPQSAHGVLATTTTPVAAAAG